MNAPSMLVPCSAGGFRRVAFVTRATGGVSWWFETVHPPGQLPSVHDMLAIEILVTAEVKRRQAQWRRAQQKRRARGRVAA